MTIQAIFENGVFRPLEPVDFPEGSQVRLEVTVLQPVASADEPSSDSTQDSIWEIRSRRYEGGEHDVAERHNEHQP